MSHLKTNHLSLYQEAMKSGKTSHTTLLPVAQFTIQESIEHAQKYEWKGKQVDILISKNQALQILTLHILYIKLHKLLWIRNLQNSRKFDLHEN